MAFEARDFKRAKTVGTKTAEAKKKRGVKALIWLLASVCVLLLALFAASVLIDYIQIREIGAEYVGTFFTNIKVRLTAQAVGFLIVFAVFTVNNLVMRRILIKENGDLALVSKIAPLILVTFIISFIAGHFISDSVYSSFLTFANSTAFNRTDPVFGQDIGYYLFIRPFMVSLMDSIRAVLIVQTIYTAVVYIFLNLRNGIDRFGDIFKNKSIVIHNIVNVLLVFVSIAMTFKYNAEEVLYGNFGSLTGAGYTDIYVWVNYYNFEPYLLLAVVAATVVFLLRGKLRAGIISVLVYPAAWLLTGVIALCVQTLVVAPNGVAAEAPNIENNIYMTREAYGLDKIIELDFPVENTLDKQDIAKNEETINNIRIIDYNANVTAMNKLQGIKPYYTFRSADIVSYDIDGKPAAVAIGAREIDTEKLAAETNDAYLNKTYKYTHGYGVAVNPMNKATNEGQPEFIVRDIPTVSDSGVVEVTQPRIYYGENTENHVIVNTKLKEIDYSEGQSNVEFSYDGNGGIKLDWLNRILFSFMKGDYKMLFSNQITSESKILANRNIIERVEKVAPFFEYDENPYMIIDDSGRLKWIIDAYAVSEYYPYAQKYEKNNYIRNSAKAVVDAYDGSVTFYVTDESDPIVMTYRKIYPEMFSKTAMPDDIRRHVRYPERLFKIQAEMYKQYHITDAHVFYNKSDVWDIAKEKYAKNDSQHIEPYYNMMKITGFDDKGESLLLTMPFTIQNKDYISSWLAAGSDDKYYGKLVLYRFTNAEKNSYGTMQMENRIDNDPTISSQMTLWGQGGSSVVRGNMIVVPVKDSLLYVEPVYITTQNTASFPELKRVIVAYKENIVMEPTLKECFDRLFAQSDKTEIPQIKPPDNSAVPPQETTGGESGIGGEAETILRNLVSLYDRYKSYNAESDYENAGRVMRDIDIYLERAGNLFGNGAEDGSNDGNNEKDAVQDAQNGENTAQ